MNDFIDLKYTGEIHDIPFFDNPILHTSNSVDMVDFNDMKIVKISDKTNYKSL